MDFRLKEEQRAFLEKISRFMKEWADAHESGRKVSNLDFKRFLEGLAEYKVMGMTVPEQHGGGGMDFVTYVLTVIDISKALPRAGTVVVANNSLYCSPLAAYGNEKQKSKYLHPCACGDKTGCYGFLESEMDSDLSDLKTIAVSNGEEWVINGVKRFVYNGLLSSCCLLAGVAEEGAGNQVLAHFIVDLENTPGFRRGGAEEASRVPAGAGTSTLTFENARVPVDAILGDPEQGFEQAKTVLTEGRMGLAAQAVGIGRAVMADVRDYVLSHRRSGKPLASSQTIQWKLADMVTNLDAAELLTVKSACYKDLGKSYMKEANIAKIYASNAAMKASHEGMQILCGQGYAGSCPLESYTRDAQICQISMGSNETVRQAVATNFIHGL